MTMSGDPGDPGRASTSVVMVREGTRVCPAPAGREMEEDELEADRVRPCWIDAPASIGGGLLLLTDVVGVVDEDMVGGSILTEVGLRTKCTVDPSEISYSFNNLLSASAFPLSKSRWVSTGGAVGDDDATRDLRTEIGSVSDAEIGKVRDGLRDLTIKLILSG